MKKPYRVKVTQTLKKKFDALPCSTSSAIERSIKNAIRNPDLLATAFYTRFKEPYEPCDAIVGYGRAEKPDQELEALSEMTRLPVEQVVRLAMEAYINRL